MVIKGLLASLAFIVVYASVPVFGEAKHKHVIERMYRDFSRGYDISVNRNITPGVFADDVGGYVIPNGVFGDLGEVIDYFYGHAAPFKPPDGVVIPDMPINVRDYVESGNIVAATVDLLINAGPKPATNDPATRTNFTVTGFYEFTDDTREATIKRLNLVIPRYEAWHRAAYPASYGDHTVARSWRDFAIDVICTRHEAKCNTPELRQYKSKGACVGFLNSLDFGTTEYAYENTVYCRWLHSAMVYARPEVHCAHVGTTGGPFCTNNRRPYDEYYGVKWTEPYIHIPADE